MLVKYILKTQRVKQYIIINQNEIFEIVFEMREMHTIKNGKQCINNFQHTMLYAYKANDHIQGCTKTWDIFLTNDGNSINWVFQCIMSFNN